MNYADTPDDPPVHWKHDFLDLEHMIEAFEKKRLLEPPSEDEDNVLKLLRHHLKRAREFLWAEVNGGLDDQYQDEVDALTQCPKTGQPL